MNRIIKPIVDATRLLLKPRGFVARGKNFSRRVEDGHQIIQIQGSMSSNAECAKFTINVGYASERLNHFQDEGDPPGNPIITRCHWRERIGVLMPGNNDHWWTVRASPIDESICEEVLTAIRDFVFPVFDRLQSDRDLISYWLALEGHGGLDFPSTLDLATLLHLRGAVDDSAKVLNRLVDRQGCADEVALIVRRRRLAKLHRAS